MHLSLEVLWFVAALGVLSLALLVRAYRPASRAPRPKLSAAELERRLKILPRLADFVAKELKPYILAGQKLAGSVYEMQESGAMARLGEFRTHGTNMQLLLLREAGYLRGDFQSEADDLDKLLTCVTNVNSAVHDLYACAAQSTTWAHPARHERFSPFVQHLETAVAELSRTTDHFDATIRMDCGPEDAPSPENVAPDLGYEVHPARLVEQQGAPKDQHAGA